MTVCVWSLLGYIVVLTVLSYFAIILLRKRELATLHKLNCCLLSVLLSSICFCSVSVPNGVMGMRGSRKFCQRGSKFDNVFFFFFFFRGKRIRISL